MSNSEAISSCRRRVMKNLLINLPEDLLIHNILLLKVPIISLLNLKCVCKYLRSIITSPAFVEMHLHHSTTTLNKHLVLICPLHLYLNKGPSQYPPEVIYSFSFNATDHDDLSCPERVEISTPFRSTKVFGSCNGLLCLSDRDSYREPCIWNPATKEYKELPSSIRNPYVDTDHTHFLSSTQFGFGYDTTINDYKVIRCACITSSQNSNVEFQVYTLGTNTWRSIGHNNPYRSYFLAPRRQGLYVNGALHWIMYSGRVNLPRAEAIIVSLDIEMEEFRELQKPHPLMNEMCSWELQVLRGCLCINEAEGYNGKIRKIHVWMMNEYGVRESWTKLFTIVEPLAFPHTYSPGYFQLLRFLENGEILISMDCNLLILYDPVKDKARVVDKLGDIRGSLLYKGIYIESLVSLESGTYRG